MRVRKDATASWPPVNSLTGIGLPCLPQQMTSAGASNNIRNDNFSAYLANDSGHELALSSTLIRFAQYFAWLKLSTDSPTTCALQAIRRPKP